MTAADFLRMVWPTEGYYALATPFTIPGTQNRTYVHKVYASIGAAAEAADMLKNHTDVFFCVHSLRERQVWNPNKLNQKTKEAGAFEVRTQANMLAGRSLFFDLDVAPAAAGKYASQADALQDLIGFVKKTGLPKPLISSSGGGLHVFWPLAEAIPSDEWVPLALKLKNLAHHHKLKYDPARTTDSASVLRVPGTYNLKDRANPRLVRLLVDDAIPTSFDDMSRLVTEALIVEGLPTTVQAQTLRAPNAADSLLGSNTQVRSGPPVSFPALVTACKQVQEIVRAKGNVLEPFWYAALGLVRYCEDGNKAAHYISSGHSGYSYDATERKLEQLEYKMVGPTTCAKLDSVNPDVCPGCSRHGEINSPLTAARYADHAPAPSVPAPLEVLTAAPVVLPPPPEPYARLKDGSIVMERGSKKDPEKRETITLLPYDFYPVRRLTDDIRGTETHLWCANLPRVGYTNIELDASAMYDSRKLATALSNKGVFPHAGAIDALGTYMVAYINTLQAAVDAQSTQTSLGWSDDYSAFVLPSKTLLSNGTAKETFLSMSAERATSAISKAGTLEGQIKLLKFFNHPDYAANQFAICAALGAPIFFATGHHGVVVNMSGPPGASKSTTLYTGASLWGNPLSYCINGTTRGATHNARDNRMAITANLPQMVDEITRMPPRDAADLAMGVTQSEGRIRLSQSGVEMRQVISNKSTIMLCTANTSLYTILSSERADSTAESMRVFEIQFAIPTFHTKADADDFLVNLKQHYGHVGEAFISYVVKNREAVVERVRQVMRAFDQAGAIQSGERFWSAAAATALVACEIGNTLGLIQYKPKVIWSWLIEKQLPAIRGAIVEQYTPPIGVMSEYMEVVNGNMLVLSRGSMRNHENIPNIMRQPEHAQLLARYEHDSGKMWLLKKAFRDYCVRYGHNFNRILEQLTVSGVISKPHDRKVLGAGTDYSKGQVWCIQIDMKHPDIAGLTPIKKPEGKVLSFPQEFLEASAVTH